MGEVLQWLAIVALLVVHGDRLARHEKRLDAQIGRIRDLTYKRARAVVRLRWSDGSEDEIRMDAAPTTPEPHPEEISVSHSEPSSVPQDAREREGAQVEGDGEIVAQRGSERAPGVNLTLACLECRRVWVTGTPLVGAYADRMWQKSEPTRCPDCSSTHWRAE